MKIGLIGLPNSGKTTIFNKLTKSNQKIGNYPGVTVEKKEGFVFFEDHKISILDLPGVYDLTTHSQEEIIAQEHIIHQKPDLVVNIIDASNIERSFI